MTPANRALGFLVMDRHGAESAVYSTEKEAREGAADRDLTLTRYAPHTIHPIGTALPAKVAEKTLGQVAYETMPDCVKLGMFRPSQVEWDRAASAVIAAHEAGKEWEEVDRFAVRWFDGDGSKLWWIGAGWSTEKKFRALYATPVLASPHARNDGARVVRITTRRRRVAK